MGGSTTGEIQIGSERELYKYVNHQAGTTKYNLTILAFFVTTEYLVMINVLVKFLL